MKFPTQLISVKKSGKGEATIVFGCGVENMPKINEMTDDVSIIFWIEGAKEEKITGHVASTSVSSSSKSAKGKFTIKSPEDQNVRTSQLSILCGREIDLNIEIDVD
jgi:hypothetical protein